MKKTLLTVMNTALFTLTTLLSGMAYAEEPIEIPAKARQNFERKINDFAVSEQKVQQQLKKFKTEEIRQLKAFREASSPEERAAAVKGAERAMLSKLGRLASTFEDYNARLKSLRQSVVAMARSARVQKAGSIQTPQEFDEAMVSFEGLARNLSRMHLGKEANDLYGLSKAMANTARVNLANRNRVRQNYTTGYISGLDEKLQTLEERMYAIVSSLKGMLEGINQAQTAQDIYRIQTKVEQLKGLGEGLTDSYLGGYAEILDYQMSGRNVPATETSGGTYVGQAFPRLSQVKSVQGK